MIVNPASAGGRTGRTWPAVTSTLREAGLTFDSALTTAPGEATVLTREALAEGWPVVVAAGGDGTVHEVVNGFFDSAGEALGSETRIGLIPLGTGGDFRRTFGFPRDTALAAGILRAGRTRRIDVGRVTFRAHDGSEGARIFCNIADAGLGGEVVHRVNQGVRLGGGKVTFTLASALSLLGWRNQRLRVEADGVIEEVTAQQVVVANARYYGGGMCIAPRADPDDGLLDLVLVGDVGKLENLRLLPHLRAGTHLEAGFPITSRRVRRVTVHAERGSPPRVDVDGEQPGRVPATFEVIPAALELIVP